MGVNPPGPDVGVVEPVDEILAEASLVTTLKGQATIAA